MRNGRLGTGMSLEAAAETIWALSSPDLHQLLTLQLGWDQARYVTWRDEMLAAAPKYGLEVCGPMPPPGGD